jgi:hypothetical protein
MNALLRRLLHRIMHRLLHPGRARIGRWLYGPDTTGQTLALVIPVRDDAAGLARLLAQARGMGVFAQIVVVDDASARPVPPAPDLMLIRQALPRGGGVARNRGLAAVTTDYVLFFDADDLLTAELPLLLADLAHQPAPFDICLFKHADARVAEEALWGQSDWDEAFWTEAGLSVGTLQEAPPDSLPVLAQTANYPWNKIFRTRFLRRHRIGCAPTTVHQDIPLHWLGFIHASRQGGRVLVSDRICAWHHVSLAGGRLTNRRGAERLQVFTALAPVARAARQAGAGWQAALTRFAPGLFAWIEDRLDAETLPRFRALAARWTRANGTRTDGAGG